MSKPKWQMSVYYATQPEEHYFACLERVGITYSPKGILIFTCVNSANSVPDLARRVKEEARRRGIHYVVNVDVHERANNLEKQVQWLRQKAEEHPSLKQFIRGSVSAIEQLQRDSEFSPDRQRKEIAVQQQLVTLAEKFDLLGDPQYKRFAFTMKEVMVPPT